MVNCAIINGTYSCVEEINTAALDAIGIIECSNRRWFIILIVILILTLLLAIGIWIAMKKEKENEKNN